jgi:hypothetical protein
MHQFCNVQIFLVIFSYDYEVFAGIISFTDFRLLHWVHILVTFVSYHFIIKWKELEFGLWEEEGEYGPNLMNVAW